MQKTGMRIWCQHQVQREVCARVLRYLAKEGIIDCYTRMQNTYNITFIIGHFQEILSTFNLVVNKCSSLDGLTFYEEDEEVLVLHRKSLFSIA